MSSSIFNFKGFLTAFALTLAAGGVTVVGYTEWAIRVKVAPGHNSTRYIQLFRNSVTGDAAFGDSIMANGFTGVPGFVNLAMGGDNFAGMASKIRLYYHDRKPGRVVIQAAPHHLSRQYVFYRDNGEDFLNLLKYNRDSLVKILDPVYRYELGVIWRKLARDSDFTPRERFLEDGSRLSTKQYTEFPVPMRKSGVNQVVQLTRPMPDPAISPVITEMRLLLAELVARGGLPCLVGFPSTRDLWEAMAPFPEFAEARRAFAVLAAETGIPMVDLSDLDLPDTEFGDFNHLNGEGARRLTTTIISRCYP